MNLSSQDQTDRMKWSVQHWNRLSFWTVTIAEREPSPSLILQRWHEFTDRLKKEIPGLRLIRVLQKNPKGDGWHIHALCDRYIPSGKLLHYARLADLGRLDFRMVSRNGRENVIGYVCRYVSRQLRRRDGVPKGTRLISAIGAIRRGWWVRHIDLRIESNYPHLLNSLISCCRAVGMTIRHDYLRHAQLLFTHAPDDALSMWRKLNPGFAF